MQETTGTWSLAIEKLNLSKEIKQKLCHCVVPENLHTPPTEGIGNSWEGWGSQSPKNLKKCIKFNWTFQRGEGSCKRIPFVGEVWIFYGTTHYPLNL